MTDKRRDDALLEEAFAALRAEMAPEPEAEAALMARVLADAERVQDETRRRAPGGSGASVPGRARPLAALREMLRALGGWPALAGLAAAGLAGVWIGIDPPDLLLEAAQTLAGGETAYLIEMDPAATFEIAEEAS